MSREETARFLFLFLNTIALAIIIATEAPAAKNTPTLIPVVFNPDVLEVRRNCVPSQLADADGDADDITLFDGYTDSVGVTLANATELLDVGDTLGNGDTLSDGSGSCVCVCVCVAVDVATNVCVAVSVDVATSVGVDVASAPVVVLPQPLDLGGHVEVVKTAYASYPRQF